MENIRVTRIQVTKLFEEINYDILLDDDKPVEIIIAPNGRGKTTILKLLAFVLQPTYKNYLQIKDVPFSSFTCYLSNGKRILLKSVLVDKYKRILNPLGAIMSEAINRKKPDKDLIYKILPCPKEENGFIISNMLKQKDRIYKMPIVIPENADAEDVFENTRRISFPEESKLEIEESFEFILHNYLKQKKCDKPAIFIGTSRLQPDADIISRNETAHMDTTSTDPIKHAIHHIESTIKTAREKYNTEVSKAKDRLPRLFLQQATTPPPSVHTFQNRWKAYSEELRKFQSVGLIEHCDEFISDSEIPEVYEKKQEFLNIYLNAFQNTTKPLEEVYKKLELLKMIFDERNSITHKSITFTSNGIKLVSRNRNLDFTLLSSGEKHDFIMFYNLIFNADKYSMILVDEPEISLHIEWQESYLDHLIAICQMNHMQAIVATHSPNIVSTHYDCIVNMGDSNDNT